MTSAPRRGKRSRAESVAAPRLIRIQGIRFVREWIEDIGAWKVVLQDEDLHKQPRILISSKREEEEEEREFRNAEAKKMRHRSKSRGSLNGTSDEDTLMSLEEQEKVEEMQELETMTSSEEENSAEKDEQISSMTARQRSKYLENDSLEEFVSLPMRRSRKGSHAEDEDEEEQMLKKSELARKRRLFAQRQDEEEKRAVIEKLIHKSNSKLQKSDKAKRIKEIKKELRKNKLDSSFKASKIRHVMKFSNPNNVDELGQDEDLLDPESLENQNVNSEEFRLSCLIGIPANFDHIPAILSSDFRSAAPEPRRPDSCSAENCLKPRKCLVHGTLPCCGDLACFKQISFQ